MIVGVLFGIFFLLLFLSVPVGVALGASTFITSYFFEGPESLIDLASAVFSKLDKYALMAIPMFILAGNLLSKGSSARRIVDFARTFVGHLPGGLPIAAIFASIIFAAVSGSSPATVAAIGSIMFGAITAAGYPKSYAVGTITASGSLGILIPPSIVMIIYGVTAEVSIGKLFIAGIIPGLLIGFMLMAVTYIGAKRLGFKRTEPAPWSEKWKKFKESFWALMTIVIIIGGIYGGIFTPTEAAAVSAVWALFIAIFIYKDIKITELKTVFLESAKTSAMIMFIIANASIFAYFLTLENIPQMLSDFVVQMHLNKIMFLVAVNILLLIAGNFMEPSSIIMIMVPLLLPVATMLGIDPIHFGVIITINMELGMLTPPVGLNLFVASGITGLSIKEVVKAVMPWFFVIFVGLLLITYIPQISLWLPEVMMGN
ncbi:C4-dicarboxylate transport system permease, large subunit [Nautilia profundicola AmH]|uniref:C4-dicarboxylate transport system permease, large subunit n=1 Tax=Nautilia profundicola (strain ATCC BAA-1463 / DSM 18972 / AmH) TaxID=598659 RepID=B9L696_NAUPA|nr:TRAP transporter large permease subunit [Nautilia profundicola]ACM92605.1 C4-dicarboxylate transport system permease, large subunit [Nautilia profundicola AmH]